MKLQLSQEEVVEAIKRYVGGLFVLSEDADMSVEFTAGRGDKGMSAEIDIRYLGVKSINLGAEKPKAVEPEGGTPVTDAGKAVDGDGQTEQQKIDGRSKAAREAKKAASIFGAKPEAPDAPVVVKDSVDRAVESFTKDPKLTPEAAKPERQEEAEEILAEEEAAPQMEEAPPVPTTPRKSLFSN